MADGGWQMAASITLPSAICDLPSALAKDEQTARRFIAL
jgi:hypothetical protein